MGEQVNAMTYLGIPMIVIACALALLFVLNIIGSILDFKGKVWPEIINFRRRRRRKKEEKDKQKQLLEDVQASLNEMKAHYSPEKLAERDAWINCVNSTMTWVHTRADEYDASIEKIVSALDANTKMTEDMFVESSRDRIIDFAERASDFEAILSHEQFRRIFRVHEDYEKFLKARNRTNGEVDTAYEMIQDGFKYRMKNHCFAEDIKGYIKK